MTPYKPMLASPMFTGGIDDWNDWAVEEKYDGHRLIVYVTRDGDVRAFTRPRKHAGSDGKTMATRELPAHLVAEFLALPQGVYDGELMAGETSTDVTRTDLTHTLRFVVFDVLEHLGQNTMTLPWIERHRKLHRIFEARFGKGGKHIALATPVIDITCTEDVTAFVKRVWERGGEGAILKRKSAPYEPGKRSKHCVKVKKCLTKVLTVVGFEATRGKIMKRGQFATVILEDEDGNRTSVKTKDDAELDAFNRQALTGNGKPMSTTHPAIGRKLRIEYQDWTPKGGYRHPRWDRWENE